MCSCTMLKGYRPDNIGEEFVEDFIENYTGFDIDLTPGSQEQHQ